MTYRGASERNWRQKQAIGNVKRVDYYHEVKNERQGIRMREAPEHLIVPPLTEARVTFEEGRNAPCTFLSTEPNTSERLRRYYNFSQWACNKRRKVESHRGRFFAGFSARRQRESDDVWYNMPIAQGSKNGSLLTLLVEPGFAIGTFHHTTGDPVEILGAGLCGSTFLYSLQLRR
jgi:hypothetical protein